MTTLCWNHSQIITMQQTLQCVFWNVIVEDEMKFCKTDGRQYEKWLANQTTLEISGTTKLLLYVVDTEEPIVC